VTVLVDYWHSTGTKYARWFSTLPGRTIRRALAVALLLWMLLSLVALARVLFTGDEVPEVLQPGATTTASILNASVVNPAALQSLNLFGEAGAVTVDTGQATVRDEVELNASKTRLNLSLEGVVTTSLQRDALAFIVYQGKQAQYYVGDKLPVGNRVTLVSVLADHVILDNGGRYESLWLYDKKKNSAAARAATTSKKKSISASNKPLKVADKRSDKRATALAKDYRQRLYKNPRSLAEVLRIVPAKKDGQLIGYKVSPGKDSSQFQMLGFEPGDVVTSINGISLDEPSKALEIYKLMRSARQANFSINRGSATMDIVVSLEDTNNG